MKCEYCGSRTLPGVIRVTCSQCGGPLPEDQIQIRTEYPLQSPFWTATAMYARMSSFRVVPQWMVR